MTSCPDTGGPAELPVERGLRELIARGYRFIHPTDEQGGVIAVVGIRVHDNVIDVVELNAEDDVTATRMPGSERDILAPTTVLWRSTGAVCRVLSELLDLPDDSTPGAPTAAPGVDDTTTSAVNGCWVPTRPGACAWLPAQV